MGRPYVDTTSTIGIDHLVFEVKRAHVASGRWTEYKMSTNECEIAVAKMIANKSVSSTSPADGSHGITEEESVEMQDPGDNDYSDNGDDDDDAPSTCSKGGDGGHSAAANYIAPTDALTDTPTEDLDITDIKIDNEVVIRCLTDDILTTSEYVIALFDIGGQHIFDVRHMFQNLVC